MAVISIHAPREGRDGKYDANGRVVLEFQSTRPARGATFGNEVMLPAGFISIHAPREGRDIYSNMGIGYELISIHAPREGRDQRKKFLLQGSGISIHAPREGRDSDVPLTDRTYDSIFQSTRPARGATIHTIVSFSHGNISIHAPREGRDFHDVADDPSPFIISIHAPREGRDLVAWT